LKQVLNASAHAAAETLHKGHLCHEVTRNARPGIAIDHERKFHCQLHDTRFRAEKSAQYEPHRVVVLFPPALTTLMRTLMTVCASLAQYRSAGRHLYPTAQNGDNDIRQITVAQKYNWLGLVTPCSWSKQNSLRCVLMSVIRIPSF
jgi:hypothetical protein